MRCPISRLRKAGSNMGETLLPYEMEREERVGIGLPALEVPESPLPPNDLLRSSLDIPSIGELRTIRYFTSIGKRNHSIEDGPYPLGSCTMKYNPKINESIAALGGLSLSHPEQPDEQVQGNLKTLYELQEELAEITGMDAVGLAPMAGAQGEFAGVLIARRYHEENGELDLRKRVLVPDSAHGTNPATAAMAGLRVDTIKSDLSGNVDIDELEAKLDTDVACMMLTQPSTLGLFDPNILKIAEMLHSKGALLYGDGANMNAMVGRIKPGNLGFDIMHLNLHKTFSTPHGGGGPGAAPVAVRGHLREFLPKPVVDIKQETGQYKFTAPDKTIGRLGETYGNFGVLVRAHAYIRALGAQGLRAVSDNAVINANYVQTLLKDTFEISHDRSCMHEFVITAENFKKQYGVRALDFAKALAERGVHPPTMYFPLTVPEALMIEPTEAEAKPALDDFIDIMKELAAMAKENPEKLRTAPHTTPVRRVDETAAARNLVLTFKHLRENQV